MNYKFWSGWGVIGTDPLTLFFILLSNIRSAFFGNLGEARNNHPPLRTTPQITPQKKRPAAKAGPKQFSLGLRRC
jgi:hypothetical protein